MIVIDATTLLLFLSEITPAPIDPQTKKEVTFAKERVDFLIKTLSDSKTKIIVPAPALSEVLVYAGKEMGNYLNIINKSGVFRVSPFEGRAAVNVALMCRIAINEGDKRGGLTAPWAKVKYDRQIVAIAQAENATAIYSDDGDIHSIAGSVGIPVIRLSECPLPPEVQQTSLPFSQGLSDEKKPS